MEKTFYIFRHGDTFVTKNPKRMQLGAFSYGFRVFSAPILPEAKPALVGIGEYLQDKKIDFAVSSPIFRCRQSAEIVAEKVEKPFIFDNRLREFILESYGSLRKRLTSVLTEIESKEYQSIAICTHAAVISALISIITAKKDHVASFSLFQFPPPGVLTVITGNTTQEINFNKGI